MPIFKFSKWLRNISEKRQKRPFWQKELKSNRTTIVALTKTTKIVIEKQRRKTEQRSELQLLCGYNKCKAVANNGEGWRTAFRITKKSRLTSLIQWIQESERVSGLKLLSFYINF